MAEDRLIEKICAQCGSTFRKDPRNSWRYWIERAKFCCQQCAGEAERQRKAMIRKPLEDAFYSFVDKSGDCWLWTGAIDRDGYGAFTYLKTSHRAHRLSLQLSGEIVPKGAVVCHDCDNPTCVNPSHLYVGTHQSNMDDAVARDRNVRGERCWSAKLTDDEVILIRASKATDERLAAKYGVSRSNISMIRSRRTWKHLP